ASIEHERAVESARRDLFTAISHDLRTPLSSIKAISEGLEHGVIEEPGEVRRYAGEIGTAVDTLVKLVDDLFELAYAEAEGLDSGRFGTLRSLVSAAMKVCEAPALEKGIAVRVELDRAGEAPCPVSLERVLQNLLVNA